MSEAEAELHNQRAADEDIDVTDADSDKRVSRFAELDQKSHDVEYFIDINSSPTVLSAHCYRHHLTIEGTDHQEVFHQMAAHEQDN